MRQNEVMQRLTVIATVFLPLSFLVGFFGMNFGWMSEVITPQWTFWVFGMGLMGVSVAATVVYLRRTGADRD
jgi:magnesium transporter